VLNNFEAGLQPKPYMETYSNIYNFCTRPTPQLANETRPAGQGSNFGDISLC